MNAHRVETVIRQDRTVVIKNLPFREGEPVEILIFPCSFSSEQGENSSEKDRYPLRGTPIKYLDPTEPVADGSDYSCYGKSPQLSIIDSGCKDAQLWTC